LGFVILDGPQGLRFWQLTPELNGGRVRAG
jgi:hypothetical protein